MKLTQKQKDNIRDLDCEIIEEIMHECAENLGLVTVAQYNDLFKVPKRTIYDQIKANKIKSLTLCGIVLIIINN